MKKKFFIQNTLITVLGVLIILMSIGYVTYGGMFEVTYAKPTNNNKFDIHFENTTTTTNTTVTDSERITPAVSNSNDTSLSFTVNLMPGEVYELTTSIRNGGIVDGILDKVSLSAKRSDGLSYPNEHLSFMVSYEDGTDIKVGDYIYAGFKKNIIVRIEYKEVAGIKLPEEDYIFNLEMNYLAA